MSRVCAKCGRDCIELCERIADSKVTLFCPLMGLAKPFASRLFSQWASPQCAWSWNFPQAIYRTSWGANRWSLFLDRLWDTQTYSPAEVAVLTYFCDCDVVENLEGFPWSAWTWFLWGPPGACSDCEGRPGWLLWFPRCSSASYSCFSSQVFRSCALKTSRWTFT